MPPVLKQRSKLSYSQKLSRLVTRLKDPEWRQYGRTLLLGKALGIASVLLVIGLLSVTVFAKVYAADAEVKAADIINPVNTTWTLIAAFLVFGMQVGFTMLEAGFCRSRETVNVLMECIVDTCLCGLLFYAIGFAFMFSHGNGFIGYHWFFLQGAPATYESTGVAFLAVWIFQFAFADTCSTITSGAMIGRTGFVGDLLYSLGVSGFHLSNHWPLGLGTRRFPRTDGQRRTLPSFPRHWLPRLCRLYRCTHNRRLRCSRRSYCSWSKDRSDVQTRRWRPNASTRFDNCCIRRPAAVVWMVWIQSRQHSLRNGFHRYWTRGDEHNACRMCSRIDRDGMRLLYE